MKIVIYTFEFLPFNGGIATYCHELARGLSSLGHSVAVVAPTLKEGTVAVTPYEVVWIPESHSRIFLMVKGIRVLRDTARKVRPDVILATEQYALLSVALFGTRLRASCIPIIHGSEVLRHSYSGTIVRRLVALRMQRFYRSSNAIICVSEFTRSLVLRKFRVREESMFVVHNGMKDEFRPGVDTGCRIRRQWDISRGVRVLLTLARLVPRKGQDTVIRALPRIREEFPDVVYLCAGEGPYKSALAGMAAALGVGEHVLFPGRIEPEDKYSYYAACDLFVMVSRQHGETVEGFGLSFLEAWHASAAVLGGLHGGVVEVIDDGVDGALVDPHDVKGVADGILKMLREPETLRDMGVRGKRKAAAYFSDLAMARSVVEALTRAHRRAP